VNRKVCEGCLRYRGPHPDNPELWLCAEELHRYGSHLLPGHEVTKPGSRCILLLPTSQAPEWCDRLVRHGFTVDGEEVPEQKDPHLRWVGGRDTRLADMKKRLQVIQRSFYE
jgi:hypothetical protein